MVMTFCGWKTTCWVLFCQVLGDHRDPRNAWKIRWTNIWKHGKGWFDNTFPAWFWKT